MASTARIQTMIKRTRNTSSISEMMTQKFEKETCFCLFVYKSIFKSTVYFLLLYPVKCVFLVILVNAEYSDCSSALCMVPWELSLLTEKSFTPFLFAASLYTFLPLEPPPSFSIFLALCFINLYKFSCIFKNLL